jgi:hypothetical protein
MVFVVLVADLPPGRGGSVQASPPACGRAASGWASGSRRHSVCLAFTAGRARHAVPGNGFCRPRGPFRQAGGLVRPRPPACHAARGGRPGQTASVCLAFRPEGVRAGPAGNGFCRTPGTFRQAGARTASPPRLQIGGGAVRVRRQVFVSRFSWKERAGRAGNGFCRTRGPSAKRGLLYGLAPPLARGSAGRRSGSDGKCLSGVSAGRAGRPCRQRFLSYPGDLPPSEGARTASPPACTCSRGGSPGQTASVRFAIQLEGAGQAVPATVFVLRRGPSAKRRAARPRPRLHMFAGRCGSDGKCFVGVSAGKSGKAVPATVFVFPGGPSAKRGWLAPRRSTLGAVRVRRQVFVSRFSWKERAGRASNGFLSYPGTFRQAGGLARPRPPACNLLAGGESGARRQVFVSRFQLERAGRPCQQRFLLLPGDLPAKRGLVRPRLPACIALAGGRSGSDGKCSFRVPAGNERAGRAGDGFCRTRGPSAKLGALVRPRLPRLPCARGGRVRVRRQVFVSRFRARKSGKAVPATVSVAPGDLPPKRGGS